MIKPPVDRRPDRRLRGADDRLCHLRQFRVFQIPIAEEVIWARSEFSLAIAIQNFAWGFGQPVFGALAERFGDRRTIIAGAPTYSAGLLLSSFAVTPGQTPLLAILVGFGIAGTDLRAGRRRSRTVSK